MSQRTAHAVRATPDGLIFNHAEKTGSTNNVKSYRHVGDAPGSACRATDPAGFGQVGCVYTAQRYVRPQ